MMIYAFSVYELEAYIQWLYKIFGSKKVFLSLDYPTLRT